MYLLLMPYLDNGAGRLLQTKDGACHVPWEFRMYATLWPGNAKREK